MQLLIALFLLFGGVGFKQLCGVKELAEELGGEELKSAIEGAEQLCKQAEEIGSLISAVRSACGGADGGVDGGTNGGTDKSDEGSCADMGKQTQSQGEGDCEFAPHGFPLKPVSAVADEGILFCLSRYIALGE
ncbi:MAG: hypothetical protein ACI4MH_07770 [Candidatus Coproplasma sp.]